MSDTDTIFAQKQTIAVLRHRLAEEAKLKGKIDELRKMLTDLYEINAELRKDKQRLDWIQFTNLTLHHWEEGDVWSRNGVYTIREFIDKEM